MTTDSEGRCWREVARLVRDLCRREELFPRRSRALVMVSGGQDSLTLLELLANGLVGENGPDAVVALHVNHHLRGKDSMDDQALVERHCSRLGVELVVVDGRVAKAAGNVQEEARNIRRQAALELAARIGCTRIALGHTLDDQVETMLYRMGRYGGLAALRGMLPNDPPWVRPLLGLRRADTAAFCRARGLEFAVDRGNLYPGYARTGLRERVLPAWEAALPGAAEAAARTAEVAAEVEQVVASVLRDLPFSVDADELDVVRVRALPIALRRLVLHSWLAGHVSGSSTRTNVLAVDRLLFGGGSGAVDIGQGCCIYKEYDLLRVGKGPLPTTAAAGAAEVVELCVPGRAVWNGVVVRAEKADRFCAPDPAHETYLDAARVTSHLTVRGVRPGDRMWPLGACGNRKLQDILVDLRVPAAERPRIPVVVCGETILWLCGLVSAEQGKITATTDEVVRLTIEWEHSGHSS